MTKIPAFSGYFFVCNLPPFLFGFTLTTFLLQHLKNDTDDLLCLKAFACSWWANFIRLGFRPWRRLFSTIF